MVPDAVVKFTVDGRDKQVRYRSLPGSVWADLEDQTGLTPITLMQRLGEGSIKAGYALLWLERKQRERRLTYGEHRRELDTDAPPVVEISDVIIDGKDYTGERVDVDEPDPTGGSS